MKNFFKILMYLLICFFSASPAFADSKIYDRKIDLNNDKKKEIVSAEDKSAKTLEGVVTVTTREGRMLGVVTVPGRITKIEIISLDHNRIRQIAVWSQKDEGYKALNIYGLKDGFLREIFRISSSYGLNANLKAKPVTIKTGIPTTELLGFTQTDKPEWNTYAWNGKTFALLLSEST